MNTTIKFGEQLNILDSINEKNMDNSEIIKLETEEQLLEKQLQAIRLKKIELAKQTQKLIIIISADQYYIDLWTPKYRNDFVDLMRSYKGHSYLGANRNRVPVEYEYDLLSNLELLSDKEITYKDGAILAIQERAQVFAINEHEKREIEIARLRREAEDLEKKPDYAISLSENKERLVIDTNTSSSYVLNTLWGITYSRNHYTIPLVEGYRLYKLMLDQKKVEWSDEALTIVKKDVEHRAYLDELVKRENSEFNVEFINDQKLRGFQKVGLEFEVATNGNCINADTMGLGKSWEWLAFVEFTKGQKNLMVCPASLVPNWVRMIHNLTGYIPHVLTGMEPSMLDAKILLSKCPKYVIINYTILGKEFSIEINKKNDNDDSVSVTENQNLWLKILNAVDFDNIGLDESHYIKNVRSARSKAARQLKAKHQMCLTGTPVLNRPGELWAPLNWIAPKLFPSYEQFLNVYTIDGKQSRNIEHLRETLRTLMIRRTRKDVLKELPPIQRILRDHQLTKKGKLVYQKAKQWIYESLQEFYPGTAGTEKQITSLLSQITRMKQIVAIDKLDTVAELATDIHDSYSDSNDRSKGEGKVIIFTQFLPVVRGLAARLAEEGVITITGADNTNTRMEKVDRFQTDPKVQFLIGTWQVMGEGLTLTAASHVIFADLFWTPGAHQQCESRAYGRMSDLHPIDSYYVITENTIEEWIQELLAAKLNIIEQLVEGRDDPTESIAKKLLQRMKEEFKL